MLPAANFPLWQVSYSRLATVKSATGDDARRNRQRLRAGRDGAKRLSGSRTRGGIAEDSSTYWLVCGGIEFHDGGTHLTGRMNARRTLVNEELRGE
jgi:hypothetical protein